MLRGLRATSVPRLAGHGDQLARRFACAVAEVDHHDLWQRSRLTLAVVGRAAGETDERVSDALRMLHSDEAFQVVGEARELIAVEGD